MDTFSSISIEKKFLSLLPPETELAAGGTTVAQRTKEIEEFRTLVDSFLLMSDDALTLPPEEKLMYFRKIHEEGELPALLWLNKEYKKQEGGSKTNLIRK